MKQLIIITSFLFLILLMLAGPARVQVLDEEVRKEVDSLIRSGYRVIVIRVDSGLYYANKAKEISDRSGYVTGQVNTLFLFGSIAFSKGKYLEAINYFQSGEALARSVNDEPSLGEAYRQIGQIMVRVEQYDQADYYLNKALRIGSMHSDTALIIQVTYDLALRAYRTGSKRSAYTGFYFGYYLSVRSRNDRMAITGLRQLGSLNLWENKPARAYQYYSLAADYAQKTGEVFELGTIYSMIAHTMKTQGRYREALAFDLKAETARKRNEQEESRISSIINIADDYLRIGQYDSAGYYLDAAIRKLEALETHFQYDLNAYKVATELEKIKGNYKAALIAFEKYSVARDSLNRQENRQEISVIETKERLAEIEQENRLLEYQNTTQELRIKFNNRVRALYITIIGVVIFLLVLFTFLYYRTRRSKAALEVLNRKLDMEMAERRQAETDLSVSEFAYRFLADNTPDMIVQLDRMGVVRYVSPSFRAVMGYSPGGSDGDYGILDTIHPDFREEMTRLFAVMVESKKPMLYTYKAIGQTGNIFWVESLANPTFDPSTGEYTGSIAVIRNIEERVKNEEQLARNARQKELLLREIHHRVKNNFAILSGVMTLQQYSADNPELTALVNDLHIRIRSMSLVHELLYKNENLDVIPFDTYLVQLSQVVAAGHRNKPVHFNCPLEPCTLDIETALPLGLIVTEILTNAFKYAFSETPDNMLTLSLSSSVNDASILPYDWKLTVRDNGRGLPEGFDLGNAHTLGSQIVTLLVDQIDGKVEAYNDAGACFNIFFYRHFERTGRLSEDDWLPLPSNGTEGNK